MRTWLKAQLKPIQVADKAVGIVLDPEGVISPSELESYGQAASASDWFQLRRLYERDGRYREPHQPKLLIHVRAEGIGESRDVPFDIERSCEVVRVGVPVPAEYRHLVLELPDEYAERAIRILRASARNPVRALVADLWGVLLREDEPADGRDLEVVVRLRTDPTVPSSLWPLLRGHLRQPLARALAEEPPDLAPVQDAWEDWLTRGTSSTWAGVFETLGLRVAPLLHAGLLRPARAQGSGLPRWVELGRTEAPATSRVRELLEARPEPWPPSRVSGWIEAAEWWGEVRAALAEGGPEASELRRVAWALWDESDAAFVSWLQAEFGRVMFRSSLLPLTVDKIAGYLARRLRDGQAERVLLVVLDGMAFAQWSTLRRASGLRVLQAGATFAMVPTLTPVSRQAIFAGRLPSTFAETIRRTTADERRWRDFWVGEGHDVGAVRYTRLSGAAPSDVPDLGESIVHGMVVGAIDEVMHGAHLLGDAQVASTVFTWAKAGFFKLLVERATDAGFEVWITADHGNLETLPSGRIHEGVAVESAGVRVRWYPNPVLREGARAEGISWDPPGLPEGACYPLFAPNRGGYFSGDIRVTHGGLSLDEVIVPFVQVAP